MDIPRIGPEGLGAERPEAAITSVFAAEIARAEKELAPVREDRIPAPPEPSLELETRLEQEEQPVSSGEAELSPEELRLSGARLSVSLLAELAQKVGHSRAEDKE